MYLDMINDAKDVKKLNIKELRELAKEVREAILKRDSIIGGHVGPNLGMVDATIAMHYVFNSPVDKIVFDVSHQCYAHKIITGRKYGYLNPEEYSKVSGYTNFKESEHDHFIVGHTSTSVSLASGLAKARDIKGKNHNVIAIIGDGSLSGGEALEGLNFAGSELNSNFIVVVNDNQMSIAENHGGLYNNLELLRKTNGMAELNMFKALGFDYKYLDDGNDIEKLIDVFMEVKDTKKPVVVHLNTIKGKGYKFAQENKEPWHWSMPFDVETGKLKVEINEKVQNYNDITYDVLKNKIDKKEDIVVVCAGTPGVFGLTKDRREELGKNYVDVGIAEEHAVAMSSALAKGGVKPVFCVMSSFIQRTYDQLSQDLALNKNGAVILVYWGGISGADATHLCCFDMAMMNSIPNLICLSPTTKQEYLAMLNGALEQNDNPVIIRVPNFVVEGREISDDWQTLISSQVVEKGDTVAILGLGGMFYHAQKVANELKVKGLNPTLINLRRYNDIDEKLLKNLKENHRIVVSIEDGVLEGANGGNIARFYGDSDVKVLCYGMKKEFSDSVSVDVLYHKNRLDVEQIVEDILNNI